MDNKNRNKKFKTIFQFIRSLSDKNKALLKEYIEVDYISGVRTGYGKGKNFLKQFNSPEGIKKVKEILKFKRLSKKTNKKK